MTQTWLDDLDADEASVKPHTGVPRAPRKPERAPAAKPQRTRAPELPPAYFIVTNLRDERKSVKQIARSVARPEHEVVRLLAVLQGEGKVRMVEGGLWERVPKE